MTMVRADPLSVFTRMGEGMCREALEAELTRRSFERFWRWAWPVHHPATPLIWNWHIPAMCDHLSAVSRGEIQNLAIFIPPGFAKSLGVSVYWPSWEWTSQPWLQYIAVGAVNDVVLRDARRMHEIVASPGYQETFLPEWTWDKSQDAKGYFANTAGGFRVSRTVGQKIIGLRGHRIIIDDPLDAADAFADKAGLEDTNHWIDNSLSSRKNSPDVPMVLIMQRLHERDAGGHFVEEYEPEVLCLPNEYEGDKHHTVIGYSDPREDAGELLCREICGIEETERRKRKRVIYASQYQQQPIPAEGIIFQEQFFKFWEPESLPDRFEAVIAAWDLNNLKRKKATTDTDYVVGQVWAAAGPDRFLLGQYRKKIGLLESANRIEEQAKRWDGKAKLRPKVSRVLIEAKANGPAVMATLAKRLPANLVEGIKVQGESKIQRAIACQPAVEGGNVHLPPPGQYPWVKEEFIPEVCGFPNRRRDDQVDAMTMALIWFNSKTTAGLWFGRLR